MAFLRTIGRTNGRIVVFLAIFAALSVSATVLGAQSRVVVDDDGTATVSATVSTTSSITVSRGTAPAPQAASWPYECDWNVWNAYHVYTTTAVPVDGGLYHLECAHNTDPAQDIDIFPYTYNSTVAVDVPPPLGVSVVTSSHLVQSALANFDPPPLTVGISPDPQLTEQVTGIESWLWPDGSLIADVTTAEVPGLSSSVTAIYMGTVFDMGDGTTVSCNVQVEWSPGGASTPCSHTYLEEGNFDVVASSTWQYIWTDSAAQGLAGWADLGGFTFDEVLPIEVVDLEALISN